MTSSSPTISPSSTSSFSSTRSKKKLSISDFLILSELGRGAYGKVLLVQSKKTQKKYAIKSIDKFFLDKLNKSHEALIEKEMLSKLDHKYLMKLIACFQNSQKLFFLMDYYKNGTLLDIINNNGILPKQIAIFYLSQLLSVLEYFQQKHIAHRDLKPNNILIDDNKHIKVIDFATCVYIGKVYDKTTKQFITKEGNNINNDDIIGTVEYASPEMLNNKVENEKSCDIWALGVIMYQMFHGFTPFKGNCHNDIVANIKEGSYTMREDLDKSCKDLIDKLLQYDVDKRIGMKDINEIKSHVFFKGVDFDNIEYPDEPCPYKVFKLKSDSTLVKVDVNEKVNKKELVVFS